MSLFSSLLRIRFVRDIITLQAGSAVGMAVTFGASVLYTRMLGLPGYGQYAVVLAFIGLFGLVTNLGQQSTTAVFLAEAHGRKDARGQAEVLRYYVLASACSILLMLVGMPLLPLITGALYGDPLIGRLAALVFAASILDQPYNFLCLCLQTVREIRTLTIVENALLVLQLAVSALLLWAGFGVEAILLGSLAGSAVFLVVTLAWYPRLRRRHGLPSLRDALRLRGAGRLWSLAKDGLWIAVSKNLYNQYPGVFLFALSLTVPESVMGLLRLAIKLAGLPASFLLINVARLSNAVLPVIASAADPRTLRGVMRKLTTHTIALYLAVIAVTFCGAVVGIPIIYGEAFRPAIYPFTVIVLLNAAMVFQTLYHPLLRLYSKVDRAVAVSAVSFAGGLLTFGVLQLALPPTRAFYVGLAVYHALSLLILLPVRRILRSPR